jgi:hypothetical protein
LGTNKERILERVKYSYGMERIGGIFLESLATTFDGLGL